MSLFITHSKDGPKLLGDGPWVERDEHPCFYCGKALDAEPAIGWIGQTSEIYLHARCTVEFILRMFRDVHQWELKTGNLVTAPTSI